MNASCVACRTRGSGMVAIYQHPNGLDQMFTSVTGVEVESEDNLCIPCYDDLKAAHIFKQKCIQNNILRISRSPASKSGSGSRICAEGIIQSEEVPVKPPAPIAEISTTSIAEPDVLDLEEHLDIRSEVSDGEDSDLQDDEDDEDDDVEEIKIGLTELHSADRSEPIAVEDCRPETVVQSTSDQGIGIVKEVKLEPIRCEECNKVFTKTSLLQRHMKSCHQAESTDDNDQLAPGALATLPSVHNMMCEYCFQEFTSLPEKFEHESAHVVEQKPYKCPQCQGTFKDKVGLRSHIRIHSAVKRYKCQYCEMRFHQRGNLTAHERTHVGAKPFLCPHCGKGFAESGNLKNHIRFHTGERPYACSECPKRFRTHYSRTVHFRSHSNDRPFRCTECEKGFYSSGKLIIHRRVHSGEKPYTCGTCPARFADSSGLKRHSKTH